MPEARKFLQTIFGNQQSIEMHLKIVNQNRYDNFEFSLDLFHSPSDVRNMNSRKFPRSGIDRGPGNFLAKFNFRRYDDDK